MIKVKEYLDKNMYIIESEVFTRNNRGVFGKWQYPKDIIQYSDFKTCDYIWCVCNNETIQINAIVDNKSINIYGYLQTYLHIPRGEPDWNGYYARSTDEEVIKYIESLFRQVAKHKFLIKDRKEKLIRLNEI